MHTHEKAAPGNVSRRDGDSAACDTTTPMSRPPTFLELQPPAHF
jgi:hypothetical protein